MPELTVNIQQKNAVNTGEIPYVCGNGDYTVLFSFDAEWEAYTEKTARFHNGERYVDRIFTGNSCPVPVFEGGTVLHIGVYAGNLRTSTAAAVRMCHSIRTMGGAPDDPEPDVYDRIMERLNALEPENREAELKSLREAVDSKADAAVVEAALGEYINDVAALVGGDA